ncbi:two-component system response regulator [Streptomyces sp. NPDC087218]|uniref:response regulator n=1 Tax=Streptomyces sp. NPDC087218 TaxID=3365769 RepID=UPI003811653A
MSSAPSSATDTKVKILLVDDRPENLLGLEADLSALGQTLVRASSGEEALKALDDDELALVLLATQMSGMDGHETASRIKRRSRTRDTPIIFVSAYEMGPHATFRGYAAGAVDHVSRPYDPWLLRAKVAVFVDLHRKNTQLRKQAALLRTRAATGLLAQLPTLLSDIETQAHDLAEQLRAGASSTTVRTMAARLEREVRGLGQVLRGEPGAPAAPESLRSPQYRDG